MWLFSILRIAASVQQFQTSSCDQASLEEKLGIPPRPKRPLTPFFRFMKEIRPSVTKENPNLAGLDVVRKVAEKYKSIDPALLRKLTEEYHKDQEEYLKTKFRYESQLTTEQKQNIIDAKDALHEKRARIAYKKVAISDMRSFFCL